MGTLSFISQDDWHSLHHQRFHVHCLHRLGCQHRRPRRASGLRGGGDGLGGSAGAAAACLGAFTFSRPSRFSLSPHVFSLSPILSVRPPSLSPPLPLLANRIASPTQSLADGRPGQRGGLSVGPRVARAVRLTERG